MKKNFILASTGEEVKIGDSIKGTKIKETSFGTIKTFEIIVVKEENINKLIDRGIIKCVPEKKESSTKDVYPSIEEIIEGLSYKYKCSIEELSEILDTTNKICPRAVLDLLLSEISMRLFNDNPIEFDSATTYYSLRPKDGKVGKVVNLSPFIPLFKSKEDAEAARRILKKQLNYMYGE